MATKAQLIEQILELNPEAKGLDKLNKADLELALAALQAQPDDEQPTGPMAALRKYRASYTTLTRADGGKSLGCGDAVQQALLAFGPQDLQALCTMADELLGPCPANKKRPEEPHAVRYAGLNNGQIRMNVGNRLRAAAKKGTLTVVDGRIEAVAG